MVQIVPSGAEGLGNAAEQFAAGLEKFMRPNHDFQIAMQKAIGGNPQLAQSLADLEYNAPGTLDRMGFGDLGRVISQVPESPDSQFRRQNRGEMLDAEKKKLAVETGGYGVSLETINDTIDYLKKAGPDVKADVALRKLGLKTADETAEVKASTEHTKAATKALESAQPTEDAKNELQYKSLQKVLDDYPALQNMDPIRMVGDAIAGKSVPEMQSYLQLPGGAQAIAHAQSIVEFRQREDERKLQQAQLNDYRDARISARQQQTSAEDKQEIIQAGAAWRSSGRAGTLAAWRTVMTHPDQVEAIRDKVKADPSIKLEQSEKDILHASDAQDQMQERLEQRSLKDINLNVRQAHATVAEAIKKGESQSGIDLALVPLNNILADQNRKTGSTYMAKYGPVPDVGQSERKATHWGSGDPGLYYVNGKNERVGDAEALSGIIPQTKDAKVDAATIVFVSQYKVDTNTTRKKSQLGKLKAQKPDIYNQVIKIIGKQ